MEAIERAVQSEYMTTQEVCEYLHFKAQTVYNKVHAGELPRPFKPGGKLLLFQRSEIIAYAARGK